MKVEGNKTPFDATDEAKEKQGSYSSILHGLQQELDKIKGKIQNEDHSVNLAHINGFTGNTSNMIRQELACMSLSQRTLITALNCSVQMPDIIKHDS